jgi:hypothetical protein
VEPGTLLEIDTRNHDSCKFTYLPDPVCARLAMCVMDENFKDDTVLDTPSPAIHGFGKTSWVSKLSECLSSHLCHQPRGDISKLFVALYMLFCGDELRRKADKEYTVFSISLDEWIARLMGEKDAEMSDNPKPSHVNFIQVCRNELRMSLKDLCNPTFLGFLYGAACMMYAYTSCPA